MPRSEAAPLHEQLSAVASAGQPSSTAPGMHNTETGTLEAPLVAEIHSPLPRIDHAGVEEHKPEENQQSSPSTFSRLSLFSRTFSETASCATEFIQRLNNCNPDRQVWRDAGVLRAYWPDGFM